MSENETPALRIENLTLERTRGGDEHAIRLRGVSLRVEPGEICVLAGEAGSGKSALCRFLLGARQPGIRVLTGSVEFEGRDLLLLRTSERRVVQRERMCFVGRHPEEAFNPDRTVRQSLSEFARLVGKSARLSGEREWSEAFYQVGIIEPERILPLRVGELPTLLVQRLALMRALISGAGFLLCDEPTAGLDRVAEREFLSLVEQLREECGLTVLLSAGRLRGMDRFADRIAVFFDGGVLEEGKAEDVVSDPAFLYTREYLAATPRITHLPGELTTISREAISEAETEIHGASSVVPGAEAMPLPDSDAESPGGLFTG